MIKEKDKHTENANVKSKHPTDIYVGQRLKQLRILRNIKQREFAKMIGLSFQQIQKYESGMNRIGASRLLEFATLLEVPVAYFFEGLDPMQTSNDNGINSNNYLLSNDEVTELVLSFNRIKNEKLRTSILSLIVEAGK